ncbi:MAG: hypothetical protein CML13_12245 [Puniceicoccaceae bacterium]|nr:hypothetical protein [Puniceicoccaceae bacterium]
MVRNLASEHGVDKKCRTFSVWSHVVIPMINFIWQYFRSCIEP